MGSKKVGISMGGTIEYTRSDKTKQFIIRKDNIKKRNAKVCIDCESNKEGYWNKFNGWCSKVNYRCNGYEKSYDEKLQQERLKHKSNQENKLKQKKKSKKKAKKKKTKIESARKKDL